MKKTLSRFRFGLPVVFLAAVLLVLPDSVWAVGGQGSDTLKGLAEIAGVVIEILTFLALLMLKFFGELLGTDMITGTEAMAAIRPMWIWVRNLTNILFVGVLLFLAFSNLFSSFGAGDGGNWTIKEKLPKLIIAMIAINFSLLGFKVVIDAVNVGTIAILGIADHRLEPNVRELTEGITGSRSWVKVDQSRYDVIMGKVVASKEAGYNPKAGDICEQEWLDNFGISNEENYAQCVENPENCVLYGTNEEDESFVCRGFTEQINDLFCRKWVDWDKANRQDEAKTDDECVFMIEPERFETILTPSSEPGQNLFAAFGSTFMHLERLPALGAEIKDLGAVVTNTLFSAILALAFIVALIAVFIAMLMRVIVLWVTLVFSPLLIAASILGVDGGKGGDISGKIITHLIMPLKVAAAFAVGFVMMSAMVEWHGVSTQSSFFFGPALSQLGRNEYGFLWQIATIVLFWIAAFWAVEGSIADHIIQQVKTGAETLAGVAAKSATIDRPLFSTEVGGQKKEFSMGAMLRMPEAVKLAAREDQAKMFTQMREGLGFAVTGHEKTIQDATLKRNDVDSLRNLLTSMGSEKAVVQYRDKVANKMETMGYSPEYVSGMRKAKNQNDINNLLTTTMSGGATKRITAADYQGVAAAATAAAVAAAKVEISGTDVKVGSATIEDNSELGAAQGVVRGQGGIAPGDISTVLNRVKDIGTGAALTVNEQGVQQVQLVDKSKNLVNFSTVAARGTTAEQLNAGGLNKDVVNIKEVYTKSDEDTQKEILAKLQELTGKSGLNFKDDKFVIPGETLPAAE